MRPYSAELVAITRCRLNETTNRNMRRYYDEEGFRGDFLLEDGRTICFFGMVNNLPAGMAGLSSPQILPARSSVITMTAPFFFRAAASCFAAAADTTRPSKPSLPPSGVFAIRNYIAVGTPS